MEYTARSADSDQERLLASTLPMTEASNRINRETEGEENGERADIFHNAFPGLNFRETLRGRWRPAACIGFASYFDAHLA